MSAQQSQGGEPADLVGTVINDRYQIIERLSEGGMGVVYRAQHTVLQSPFAIKVLLHPQMKKAQQRFLMEARLASKINHPNTVYIADFGVLSDDRPYLAMEFLAGPTLSSLIKSGPMDQLRAAQITLQIARGLQAVHDKGIIHCDLKPENVFVLKQGAQGNNQDFVKIVDFGIATSLNQDQGPLLPDLKSTSGNPKSGATLVDADDANRTVTGGIVGTPPYMAPEQVRGHTLDFRVDQYALGCILYQLLCGKTPFDGPNMNAILMSHIFDPVPALSTRGVTVSKTLEAIVLRLLEKDVAARFGSMLDVEAALAAEIDLLQLLRGEKTAVPRALASVLGVESKSNALFVLGRRVPLWLLGSVIAVLVVGVGLTAYQLLRSREQKRELQPGELQELRKRALAVLQESLKTTDAASAPRRIAALTALGQSHDLTLRESLEAELHAAVDRKETDAQIAAAEALGNLGDRAAVPKLAAVLDRCQDPAVRASVASSLRQLGDARGIATLNSMLESKDAEAQLRASMLLCEGASGRALSVLSTVSKQEQAPSTLRISALFCLAQVADATARRDARQALSDLVRGKGPVAERVLAAARLGDLGDDTGRDFLRLQVKRPGPVADQLLAARMLAGPEEPQAVGLCRRVVHEKAGEPSTRQLAAQGLAAGGDLFDARLLGQRLVTAEPSPVRESSAAAIVLLAAQDPSTLSEASLTWARSALQDKDALARLAAAAALADVQGDSAVQLLSNMMHDKDAAVRRGAVRALGRRSESEALSALISGLDDADPDVREETIRSLGRMTDSRRKRAAQDSNVEAMKRLKEIAAQGSSVEQVLAAATLMNWGESGQDEKLRGMSRSDDVEVRKLVVEQARGDQGILLAALSDQSSIVRFAAARRLAEQGDKRAEPVLREVLEKGGRESLLAYGLLRKLGIAADGQKAMADSLSPTDAPKSAEETEQRLAQIEALGHVPTDVALPALRQASRDAQPAVRRAALDALAEQYRSSRSSDVMATLRRMLSDSDPGVRARAAALVSSLGREGTEPAAPIAKPAEPPSKEPAQKTPVDPAGTGGSARTEQSGPASAADGGASDGGAATKPTTETAEKTPQEPTDEKTSSKPSQAEQLLRSGLESYARRELKKAQRQLQKVNALCSRNKKAASDCPLLMAQAGLKLGQIFEAQKEPGEAMSEYQRVVSLGGAGKSDLRSEAEQAVSRLSSQLGQVITLQRDKKGKCVQGTIWLPPGSHMVKLGGKIEPIDVQAQSRVQVGSCS